MNELNKPAISVIVPLYDEADSLIELHRQIGSALMSFEPEYEIIFVDDGSRDSSLDVLKGLREKDRRIRVISFRRNYGKSAALAVGFRAARAEFVVTMDADLQDDPAEIPMLVETLKEGWDLVSGWKKTRHDPISKTLPSKFFNYVTGRLSGIRLHDFNCGLKAYRHDVVKEIPVYGELHRFLPVLAHRLGFRVTERPVHHRARQFGRTKFGMSRFFNGFFDLLTVLFISGFTRVPLHLFGTIGLVCTLVGLAINTYLTVGWLNGIWIGNRPLLMMGTLMMVIGIQFFSFGLIGEMMANSSERDRDYSVKLDTGQSAEMNSRATQG